MDEELLQDEHHEHDDFAPVGGPGKSLGIFFGVVLLCAICFAIGYRLGKGSEPAPAEQADTQSAPPVVAGSAVKPSAGHGAAESTAAEPPAINPASPAASNASSAPPSIPKATASKPAPMTARGGGFAVQVAAVSKEEDADALVNALRGKDYPVFVVNSQPGDKLFHVQVGPFATLSEAEAMRAKLASAGYNPIIKK